MKLRTANRRRRLGGIRSRLIPAWRVAQMLQEAWARRREEVELLGAIKQIGETLLIDFEALGISRDTKIADLPPAGSP